MKAYMSPNEISDVQTEALTLNDTHLTYPCQIGQSFDEMFDLSLYRIINQWTLRLQIKWNMQLKSLTALPLISYCSAKKLSFFIPQTAAYLGQVDGWE